MAQDDISFGISGENAAFMRALKESQDAVKDAAERMHSSFEGVSAVFEKITGALGIFSAALAGGAAFKEAIDTTVELTVSAEDLGRQFGVSATQASILRVALDEAHVSTETFQAAGNAMTRQLNKNEDAFKNAGIAIHEHGGELRNQLDIMLDAIDHLAKLKEGTDRNLEGQRLFGRSWGEMGRIVNVTSEAMREAADKADALGLSVGGEQLAATERYRTAMNDVKDVMTGVKNVIGQAVMPILTELGEWFGSIGPGVVETFRVALAGLAVPFRVITLGLEVIYETGKAVFTQLAQYATTFAQMFNRALHGDFSGAAQAWRSGMGRIEQIGNEYWEKIAADAERTQKRIVDSFAAAIVGPKVTPIASTGGTNASESDLAAKRAMELLREQMHMEDQHAQSRLKMIALDIEETDRFLAGEERAVAAGQRDLELLREQTRANDQNAASRLRSISTQLEESDRFLQSEQRAAQKFQQQWGAAFRNVATAFGSAFLSMARGSQSFGEAMRSMFASIAAAAVENTGKNIAMMALQSAVGRDLGSAQIRKDAGEAAAGAYKAIVGIPYVGPFLAPAAAAVAYAGVLAFDSAEAGYDIPAGLNPVTQLHQREMVLPAPVADTVRNAMSEHGKDAPRGGGSLNVQFVPVGRDHGLVQMKDLAGAIKKLNNRFALS
jgi:hypothetical protein